MYTYSCRFFLTGYVAVATAIWNSCKGSQQLQHYMVAPVGVAAAYMNPKRTIPSFETEALKLDIFMLEILIYLLGLYGNSMQNKSPVWIWWALELGWGRLLGKTPPLTAAARGGLLGNGLGSTSRQPHSTTHYQQAQGNHNRDDEEMVSRKKFKTRQEIKSQVQKLVNILHNIRDANYR